MATTEERATAPTLTETQCVNRVKEITAELERLGELDTLSADQEAEFEGLTREFTTVEEHRKRLIRDAKLAVIRSAASDVKLSRLRLEAGAYAGTADENLEPDSVELKRFKDPWDTSGIRTFGAEPGEVTNELQARALTAIERMPYANHDMKEATTQLVERSDDGGGRLSQLCLATSSPDYVRAFAKVVGSKGQSSVLSGKERDVYLRADSLMRAMSLTDAAGGFLVPFQLDPTVILTANGSSNAIRQIARVVQITGDAWNGLSSAGVTGSWDAEAAEVSDDAPTFAAVPIPVYKGAVFVPISFEAQQDEANVAQEIARMIAFEKDRMESVAFTTGSGTAEPTGIVTALTGTASVVPSATADTFAVADIYALDSALPARYAAGASWLAHRAVYNLTRRFDTQGGSSLWAQLGQGLPAQLLGRPVYETEAMDSTVTALAANPLAIFGDFQNFVIADRIGTTISFIPHLFGATRRPTGQSGWYAHFRVGSDSVNDAAFRMLDVT